MKTRIRAVPLRLVVGRLIRAIAESHRRIHSKISFRSCLMNRLTYPHLFRLLGAALVLTACIRVTQPPSPPPPSPVLTVLPTSAPDTPSPATPTPLPLPSVPLAIVRADQGWQSTALVVQPGQQFEITATGIWSHTLQDTEPPNPYGPGGTDRFNPDSILSSAPHGALLGRIGDNPPFVIGERTILTSPHAGELWLSINDQPEAMWDNSGSLDITIALGPAPNMPTPLLINGSGGYLLSYPAEYQAVINANGICLTLSETSTMACHEANAFFEVRDAAGRTLSQVADEIAATSSSDVNRTSLMVADEEATRLDNIAATDILRKVVILHGDRAYIWTFVPWAEDQADSSPMGILYNTVINSFTFLPQAETTARITAVLPPLPQSPGSNLCPGTQPSLLMPGRQGQVSAASAAPNRVRSEPSTSASMIGEIPAGEYFDVLAGPTCADGWAWFQVRTETLEGWMAEGSADEYWVQPILTDAQDISGPTIELPGFEFVLPEAVGSKMSVSHWPYNPETRTPPVSLAQFADYPLPNANAVIYVYPVEDYLYYRPDQREALEQIRAAINTLLNKPDFQVVLPSVPDWFQLDDVTLTQAGAFKDGFGLHAVARLSPIDGSAEPKPYYVFFGYSSDMKYLIFAKLDVNLNVRQLAQAGPTDFTPSLSLLDEIFNLDLPHKCETAAVSSDNLAYQKPARASASLSTEPPAQAVDENNSTQWGAGTHAPQWIEIDLGQAYHLTEIRLMVEQWPEGDTAHRIQGRSAGGAFVDLHTFRQKTSGCDWLIYTPEPATAGIQIIRVDTLSSPSWVAWREILVYGEAIP